MNTKGKNEMCYAVASGGYEENKNKKHTRFCFCVFDKLKRLQNTREEGIEARLKYTA